MLEILSVHDKIGTCGDTEDAALTDPDFTESFGGKLLFIGNPVLHSTIMTLTAQVDPLPTTPVFSTPQAFRCPFR